jgi:hypothetical protein
MPSEPEQAEHQTLLIGCGEWLAHCRRGGPPAIPCVPFTVTTLGILASAVAWVASGTQLAFLPFCFGSDDGTASYCASPLQLLGLATWTIQSRLWAGAERDLQASTAGSGAGNFTSVNRLVTTGQFGVCRNPLYLVTLLLFAPSIGVLCNSLWFVAVCTSLQFINYNFLVVPAEEKLLRRKFGEDFDLYCARVGRWCPWF